MSQLEFTEEIANWNTNAGRLHHCKTCKLFKTPSMFFMSNHAKRHERGLQFFNCVTGNVEMYFCEDCNFTTDLALTLKKHILQRHMAQSESEIQILSRRHVCRNCNFQTESTLTWFKHLTEGCNYKSKIQNKHGINNPTDVDNEFYEWEKCGYITQQVWRLKRHKSEYGTTIKWGLKQQKVCKQVEDDKEIQWHTCGKCDFKTKNKNYLTKHNEFKHLEEHEVKWYTCGKCEYKTKHKHTLSRHNIIKHLEDHEIPWYNCDKCEYRTMSTWHLKRHKIGKHLVKVHEIRWYNCDECEYRSKVKESLRSHKICKHLR